MKTTFKIENFEFSYLRDKDYLFECEKPFHFSFYDESVDTKFELVKAAAKLYDAVRLFQKGDVAEAKRITENVSYLNLFGVEDYNGIFWEELEEEGYTVEDTIRWHLMKILIEFYRRNTNYSLEQ